jgi:NAD(P)-dependent dehydrogenase (short-subunit alcohol dehydrogenase family)
VGSAQPWYIGSPAPTGTFWQACAVSRTPVLRAHPLRVTPVTLDITEPDDIAAQLDVNVVDQMAVVQATLPRLRASRGRVVFVSSVSGPYNASTFALEGIADALRMEISPGVTRRA